MGRSDDPSAAPGECSTSGHSLTRRLFVSGAQAFVQTPVNRACCMARTHRSPSQASAVRRLRGATLEHIAVGQIRAANVSAWLVVLAGPGAWRGAGAPVLSLSEHLAEGTAENIFTTPPALLHEQASLTAYRRLWFADRPWGSLPVPTAGGGACLAVVATAVCSLADLPGWRGCGVRGAAGGWALVVATIPDSVQVGDDCGCIC